VNKIVKSVIKCKLVIVLSITFIGMLIYAPAVNSQDFSSYHNYDEMTKELKSLVSANKSIAKILATVGINCWENIKDSFIDKAGNFIYPAIVLHQVPYSIETDFPSLDFVPVDIGINIHCCFTKLRSGLRIINCHIHYILSVKGFPGRFHFQLIRKGLFKSPHIIP